VVVETQCGEDLSFNLAAPCVIDRSQNWVPSPLAVSSFGKAQTYSSGCGSPKRDAINLDGAAENE
jgi:hypothetical protein